MGSGIPCGCFRLKDGQISPVVKTRFGYHIIQMVSRNGDDAVIRHILRIPQITQPEIVTATLKLDSIRQQLVSGSIGFGEAVAKYSDDENANSLLVSHGPRRFQLFKN